MVEAAGRSNETTGESSSPARSWSPVRSASTSPRSSDENRRDIQFRGRIMDVEQFPGATFTLTAPIKFGAVPATAQPVTASATGDLTLHGVTRSVTIT
ncbi:MAG: YceI family protein [Acidimicrobiia bacterium]|nr:YceI family protein [Acidimicrobiia bacterium]